MCLLLNYIFINITHYSFVIINLSVELVDSITLFFLYIFINSNISTHGNMNLLILFVL